MSDEYERAFWGNCVNTLDEDLKHVKVYAHLMGLRVEREWVKTSEDNLCRSTYSFDAKGKRILDIGGGPTSMLLKCFNLKEGKIIDPLDYPQWTKDRYKSHNISVDVKCGEDIEEQGWDEVWIYNVLQHVKDPAKIIDKALKAAPTLRLFEWINIPPHSGHPHMLTSEVLDEWIGTKGNTAEFIGAYGCSGQAYYVEANHD